MRTKLDIDDDVLSAARAQAALEGRPLGAVISSLARSALRSRAQAAGAVRGAPVGRFAVLPVRDEVVTVQRVRRLMDGAGG